MIHKLTIPKKDLHFAAFVKSRGATLTHYANNLFHFESEKSEMELRVLHANSDALRVDKELLTLRRFYL